MRYTLLVCQLISTIGFTQNEPYKLTEKDTLITCSITDRSTITGPFVDTHSKDFETLAIGVFNASPFPEYQYLLFRATDPTLVRIGHHSYDDLEYRTFMLYNLDSAMLFNPKAKTRYGLMSILAHQVGHHAFNHFLPWPQNDITTQELQADYFAGWLLAKLNVPQADITKGITVITADEGKGAAYPLEKDRVSAMLLGYAVNTTAGAGPLALLENGEGLSDEWLKKWSRIKETSGKHNPLTETTFTNTSLELDDLGQLLHHTKAETFVIARAMPTKDKRYVYLLFDNQLNYWWIERDGTIKNSNGERTLAHVDLSVIGR